MPHVNPVERRAYAAKYRAANRTRVREYQQSYLASNPERRAATVAASNANAETKRRKAEYREANREALRAAGRAYAKANRVAGAAALARYRSAKVRATPAWARHEEMRKVYALARMMTETTGVKHHVDHIVPLVSDEVCGLHCEFNLQVLTAVENQKKGNREWPKNP